MRYFDGTGVCWRLERGGRKMTTIQLEIPEEMAESIREQGLMNPDGLREMLRDSLRVKANVYFKDLAGRVERLGIPPMSEEEIQAEIDAARAERKQK